MNPEDARSASRWALEVRLSAPSAPALVHVRLHRREGCPAGSGPLVAWFRRRGLLGAAPAVDHYACSAYGFCGLPELARLVRGTG